MNVLQLLIPKVSVVFLYDNSTVGQGMEKIKVHRYTALPVVSRSGKYVGTVSEGDFLWNVVENDFIKDNHKENMLVRDIIRKGWNPSVTIDVTFDELVVQVMEQNFVPVVDDRGFFMGIITRRDIIKHLYNLA